MLAKPEPPRYPKGNNLSMQARDADKPYYLVGVHRPYLGGCMKEISLRPYNGRLFVAYSIKEYEELHKKLFKTPDVIACDTDGRFSGGEGKDGMWTYLLFARNQHSLAHELSHVVLHVFDRCGINPIEAGGEPFCYMLSQLILDANCKEIKV